MRDALLAALLFAAACLGSSMVHAATRATELRDIVRETGRAFVSLAGGLLLIAAAIWLVVTVAQA